MLETSAVQMCARKVAAVAGDARTALDVCRRAVEVVESDTRRQLKLGIYSFVLYTRKLNKDSYVILSSVLYTWCRKRMVMLLTVDDVE